MDDKKTSIVRGRPRRFCVDQALTVALELFRQRGYDGVGVAELAAAMGVAAPSLYSAFGSKAELYARALDLHQQRHAGFVEDALARGGDPAAIVTNILGGAAAAFAGTPGGCLIISATGCSDPQAAQATIERRAATRDAVERRLASAGAIHPGLLADYVMVALNGLSAAAREGMPAAQLQEIAARLAAGAAA